MRVFVTGSTGYIGSAVVRSLVRAGHEVGGLVRSTEKEASVRQAGAVPIFGHLRDPGTYQHFAAESDAVVHCAFEDPQADQVAAEELCGALQAEGGRKAFVYTSGVWVLGVTSKAADESAPTDRPLGLVAWRPPIERFVTERSSDELACAIVRPGLVYGGGRGLFAGWFASAAEGGGVRFIGDGKNHFPPIHVDDLAELYRLVVEKRATGIFHGVDGSAPTIAEAAEAVSRASKSAGRTSSWPLADAQQKLGAFADAMAADQVIVTKRAGEVGWKAGRPFVERVAAG